MTTNPPPADAGQDTGASPGGDRAVVNGAGQAVSALRASVPSAEAAALELIYLTNWMWEGGGSKKRISHGAGSTCREVLGLPLLPDGWPTEDEYQRRAVLSRIIAQGIEAGTAETEGLGAKHESPVGNADAPKELDHE